MKVIHVPTESYIFEFNETVGGRMEDLRLLWNTFSHQWFLDINTAGSEQYSIPIAVDCLVKLQKGYIGMSVLDHTKKIEFNDLNKNIFFIVYDDTEI